MAALSDQEQLTAFSLHAAQEIPVEFLKPVSRDIIDCMEPFWMLWRFHMGLKTSLLPDRKVSLPLGEF